MKSVSQPDAGQASPCLKRNWVLTTLSDDEALAPDGSLPPGLKFHLSRCPSCRREADRLLSVSEALRTLSAMEPPVALLERAGVQLATALAHGAALSGRVAVSDDDDADLDAPRARWSYLWTVGRYAAAAAVVFAVGWAGLATLDYSPPRRILYHQPTVSLKTAPGPAASSDVASNISQPAPVPDDPVTPGVRQVERRKRTYCTGLPTISDDVPQDANCTQRAFVLPSRAWHDTGPGPQIQRLDNRPPPVSTTRLPNER